jgi:hypothetical protein
MAVTRDFLEVDTGSPGGTSSTTPAGVPTWYVWPVVGGERTASAVVHATVSIPG